MVALSSVLTDTPSANRTAFLWFLLFFTAISDERHEFCSSIYFYFFVLQECVHPNIKILIKSKQNKMAKVFYGEML